MPAVGAPELLFLLAFIALVIGPTLLLGLIIYLVLRKRDRGTPQVCGRCGRLNSPARQTCKTCRAALGSQG